MSARAIVEHEWERGGVRIAASPSKSQIVTEWGPWPVIGPIEESGGSVQSEDSWLHLDEDTARAIYEALADHYGHTGNDTRALRRDYDAERARVDRLIAHVTEARP